MQGGKIVPEKNILAITAGCMGLYIYTGYIWLIWIAFVIALMSILLPQAGKLISYAWMKIAWLPSKIIPPIILTLVFFLLLWPVAFLSKWLGNRDPLMLKKRPGSIFRDAGRTFDREGFNKPW